MPGQRDLSGVVQRGRGLGKGLMADRVVMEKLQELSGFPVVPGTLNVRLPGPLERGSSWRYVPAVEITPDWEARTGQAGVFPGTCHGCGALPRARLSGRRAGRARVSARPDRAVLRGAPARGARPRRWRPDCGLAE